MFLQGKSTESADLWKAWGLRLYKLSRTLRLREAPPAISEPSALREVPPSPLHCCPASSLVMRCHLPVLRSSQDTATCKKELEPPPQCAGDTSERGAGSSLTVQVESSAESSAGMVSEQLRIVPSPPFPRSHWGCRDWTTRDTWRQALAFARNAERVRNGLLF